MIDQLRITHHALRSAITTLESYHIEDARRDAELLLAEACGVSRAHLLAHLDDALDENTRQRFDTFVARRAQHEPVAYILGRKEFYGLELRVDRRVLIPRPETELLVECALRTVRDWRLVAEDWTIVDVGTGSGAVAIALASNLQSPTSNLHILAADISADALAVARANAERHRRADRIRFVQSDLLTNVDVRAHLIVANLPYIARDEWCDLAPDIADYEPRLALDGGTDGLDAFRKFLVQAPSHLAPNGAIMLEIGATQTQAVSDLARNAFPQAMIEVKKDLAGLDRVVIVQS